MLKQMLKQVEEYLQQGIFITYDITNQKVNGSWEEGDQVYTFSFYITPEDSDYVHIVSVNTLEEGYSDCLKWLEEHKGEY